MIIYKILSFLSIIFFVFFAFSEDHFYVSQCMVSKIYKGPPFCTIIWYVTTKINNITINGTISQAAQYCPENIYQINNSYTCYYNNKLFTWTNNSHQSLFIVCIVISIISLIYSYKYKKKIIP